MITAQEKGKNYFDEKRITKIEITDKVIKFHVRGTELYVTEFDKVSKLYKCTCKDKYLGKDYSHPTPFCSHCWAMVFFLKDEKDRFPRK